MPLAPRSGDAAPRWQVALTPGAFLAPWAPDVDAVVVSVFPGEAAGLGLADVLTGAEPFSGKLPCPGASGRGFISVVQLKYPGGRNCAP